MRLVLHARAGCRFCGGTGRVRFAPPVTPPVQSCWACIFAQWPRGVPFDAAHDVQLRPSRARADSPAPEVTP